MRSEGFAWVTAVTRPSSVSASCCATPISAFATYPLQKSHIRWSRASTASHASSQGASSKGGRRRSFLPRGKEERACVRTELYVPGSPHSDRAQFRRPHERRCVGTGPRGNDRRRLCHHDGRIRRRQCFHESGCSSAGLDGAESERESVVPPDRGFRYSGVLPIHEECRCGARLRCIMRTPETHRVTIIELRYP